MIENEYFRKEKDRRYRMLWLTPELLMNSIFDNVNNKPQCQTRIVEITGFPRDCQIIGVHYSDAHRAFGFMLYHESFKIVPANECVPSIDPLFRQETIDQTFDSPAVKIDREFI